MKYFLSLGSNVNAKENIDFALSELLSSVISSTIHQTPSVGFEGNDFLNLVVSGDSECEFDELNKKLKDIEDRSGRDRNKPKFSSRSLDIDIVLQLDGDQILFESDEISKYTFVSLPLKEII